MIKNITKKMVSIGAAFFFLLAAAAVLHADPAKVVTAEVVKNILDSGQKAIIVDARTAKEYQDERIPSAVLIPVEDFEKQAALLLPDKKTLIIFYCNGVNCGKAPVAAEKALQAGYTNVEVLGGGIPEWKEKGYRLEGIKAGAKRADIKKLVAEALKTDLDKGKSLILVDVREKDEYAAGHVAGALNLPLSTLEKNYGQLPEDKRVVLYCNSAQRSNNAAQILLRRGYKDIEEMEGFKFWVQKGLPETKGM